MKSPKTMIEQRKNKTSFKVDEREFAKHRDFFLQIAREKYPDGFTMLKAVHKVSMVDGNTGYQVEFSDPLQILLEYLGSQYSNEESQSREEVLDRIIQHLISHGYK
jgi:hypothetical protein